MSTSPLDRAGWFRYTCSLTVSRVRTHIGLCNGHGGCRVAQPVVLPVGNSTVQAGLYAAARHGRPLVTAVRHDFLEYSNDCRVWLLFLRCDSGVFRRSERAEFAGDKLIAAWQAEVAAHGDAASLKRAFSKTWAMWYIPAVIWATGYMVFGCLSGAVFMRTIIRWFETHEHSTSYMLAMVAALVISEITKVRGCVP
jgi:hypothetical protein